MKYVYNILCILILSVLLSSCTDEPLIEDNASDNPFFNIEAFSEGYSLAFDVSLNRISSSTRDDLNEAKIQEWDNHLDPEEFRVLFFDQNDQFLFESRSRWFTKVTSTSTADKWRVGVPLFPYLSDGFDENNSDNEDSALEEGYNYNWDGIIEIMRTQSFKIAILANRPTEVHLPKMSDLTVEQMRLKNFGKNGPFWSARNSIATSEENRKGEKVKKVFDLHHCQYDPIYENKNGAVYEILFDYDYETMDSGERELVPQMGAISSWLHGAKIRNIANGGDRRYYRLPEEQHQDDGVAGLNIRYKYFDKSNNEIDGPKIEDPQYIPMYGIQSFSPITNWVKGTTFNLSEQSGSQTGDRVYTPITLLRSVVKLELRIPMKDSDGDPIDVDKTWMQIWANNYLARCEPMDVSTPTDQIWKDNHTESPWLDPSEVCEWKRIRDFGPINDKNYKGLSFKSLLSWYYGCWQDEKMGWNFAAHGGDAVPQPGTSYGTNGFFKAGEYPRVFNPITQRLQSALISDCNIDIDGQYYRWVVYCGEKNINDPNTISEDYQNDSQYSYINFFRFRLRRKVNGSYQWYVYTVPITDYTDKDNPAYDILKELGPTTDANSKTTIENMSGYPSHMNAYFDNIKSERTLTSLPFPLLRNHAYTVELSFGNGDNIDVQVMDAETRIVGGIVFD